MTCLLFYINVTSDVYRCTKTNFVCTSIYCMAHDVMAHHIMLLGLDIVCSNSTVLSVVSSHLYK